MKKYNFKNNIKIEAFQQQFAEATYNLPAWVDGVIETYLFTAKVSDWVVKYSQNDRVWYEVMTDKYFRETHEAVSEQPAPRKNLEQDMMDYIRRMEEERLKRDGVKPFTPVNPWQEPKIPWPRGPLGGGIYWCISPLRFYGIDEE
jgi:hypothetical protein